MASQENCERERILQALDCQRVTQKNRQTKTAKVQWFRHRCRQHARNIQPRSTGWRNKRGTCTLDASICSIMVSSSNGGYWNEPIWFTVAWL